MSPTGSTTARVEGVGPTRDRSLEVALLEIEVGWVEFGEAAQAVAVEADATPFASELVVLVCAGALLFVAGVLLELAL